MILSFYHCKDNCFFVLAINFPTFFCNFAPKLIDMVVSNKKIPDKKRKVLHDDDPFFNSDKLWQKN